MKGGGRGIARRTLRSLNTKIIVGDNTCEWQHADCNPCFENQEDKTQDKTQCLRFELVIKTNDTQLAGYLSSEGNL